MRNLIKHLLTITILSISNVYAEDYTNQLGAVHIFVSESNLEAQKYFMKGLLLLHSFEYEEARSNFESAQNVDHNFAMAYWGEAMTYNHPVWNEQNYIVATNVLNKLSLTAPGRMAKAPTELEKGFINALNVLYGSGSKQDRDYAYAAAMRNLYKTFPDSEEAGAFYALSILGITEGSRDFRNYMQAAGVLEQIYQKNNKHPGIIHYLIHTYDDPIHAPLGLRFAREYAQIAPSAAHALHMPSHIYLALGMWDDVVNSNLAAWNAGIQEHQHTAKYDIHALHALQWLSYGYLQQKNFAKAYQTVQVMEAIVKSQPNDAMSKWYYSLMRAAYMSEMQEWNANLINIDLTGIEISAVADNAYVEGMKEIKTGNAVKIQQALDFAASLTKISPGNGQAVMGCHNDANYFNTINEGGIVIAKIVYLELKAQQFNAKNDLVKAIAYAKQAADIENSLSFGYGPPLPAEPANELLAKLYFKNKQFELAYKQFAISLEHTPNRAISRDGMQKTITKLHELKIAIPHTTVAYFNPLM